MTLTQEIKAEAIRQGFSLAGVTTPAPPPHWPVFQDWLKMGRHASMGYLTNPKRADPRNLLSNCQSILVLALSYPTPVLPGPQVAGRGQISVYAQGEDYHLVIKAKLKALSEFIENQAGAPVDLRCYTDSAPLLERDLAQRAGLGWIGRNTCLIHPSIGSHFFLAEILLSLPLEIDPPFTSDRCGTCHRCIQACPTACLLPNRTLDARHCIAFLTIENKGQIPEHLRSKIGTNIFGCDICQAVCPWTIHARATSAKAFTPRPALTAPRLEEELALTQAEFKQKFTTSPILRARRAGYLRNVAVALGNLHDPSAIPVLTAALQDEEELVRIHARWALEQISSPTAQRTAQATPEG